MGEDELWVNMNYEWIWFMCKYELWVYMNYEWKWISGGEAPTHTHRHTQTHQYHDSAWPRGQAEWKYKINPAKWTQVLPVDNWARVNLPWTLCNIRTPMVSLPWEGIRKEEFLRVKLLGVDYHGQAEGAVPACRHFLSFSCVTFSFPKYYSIIVLYSIILCYSLLCISNFTTSWDSRGFMIMVVAPANVTAGSLSTLIIIPTEWCQI